MTQVQSVGDVIAGPARTVTPQRIEWYDSALLSACSNEPRKVGANIHTDDEFARNQGLPAAIADGMIMANYCSEMMIDHFGFDYMARGELRTKFIKPVFIDVLLRTFGRIRSIERMPDGSVHTRLDVWCEDDAGNKLTDGEASATTTPATS